MDVCVTPDGKVRGYASSIHALTKYSCKHFPLLIYILTYFERYNSNSSLFFYYKVSTYSPIIFQVWPAKSDLAQKGMIP